MAALSAIGFTSSVSTLSGNLCQAPFCRYKYFMASSDSPVLQKVSALCGRVVTGEYGKGSKSERPAIFLETGSDRFILRRKTGPVFGDDELQKYVGQQVECDGFLSGNTLLAEKIIIT